MVVMSAPAARPLNRERSEGMKLPPKFSNFIAKLRKYHIGERRMRRLIACQVAATTTANSHTMKADQGIPSTVCSSRCSNYS